MTTKVEVVSVNVSEHKGTLKRPVKQIVVDDLGVVGDQPMPLDAFFAIQDMLEELPTLYRIDWVDFARAGEKLKERALRNVEVLHG